MKYFATLFLIISQTLLANPHPLDDLSSDEIKSAVSIVRATLTLSPECRFPIIYLEEPSKDSILKYQEGKSLPRLAHVGILEASQRKFWEVIVDLNTKKIIKSTDRPGVQPPILLDEYARLSDIVKADPNWISAIKKRNLDPKDIFVDGWTPGVLSAKERKSGMRLLRALTYFKGTAKNFYARPIEGILVTVNMNDGKVLEVVDLGIVPIATGNKDFDPDSNKPLRAPLSPLKITQKNPSFKVSGNLVEWDKWKFRYSLHPQKGLTLYQATYKDQGKERSVLYKAHLADMVVPYGDNNPNWIFRNAFDVGEYGVGRTTHSMEIGKDAPENAKFFDAVFANDLGEPFTTRNAVMLYERDGGVLWKHLDQFSQAVETRRGRELVLGFMTTVGNYDYGIHYIFHQDGLIEVEVQLTGILLAKGSALKENPCIGGCMPLVEPNIVAPNHQHFFNFRLDLDIDGATKNVPVETNIAALKIKNPGFNAFEAINTNLLNEKSAVRDFNYASARRWKVISTDAKNKMKHPTGYCLLTGENSSAFLTKESSIWKRADFIHHPIWFTRYHDEEQSGSGEYPNQDLGGNGLNSWTKNNESLDGQDVVMWYTFGITHIPRPEDWPVMPTHKAGFKLMPVNFFDQNPAMDLP